MELEKIARKISEMTINEIECAKSGHLSSSLSSVNIITALYFSEMKHDPKDPYNEERDRFVLSKGHAVPALYSALALAGYFDKKELCNLRHLGSRLHGHPSLRFSRDIGIEASTGSLGQGFSIACGMALAAKLENKKYWTYVLLGDGECDEGIVWESALFASHNRLNNLIAFIDRNGTQMDGSTKEVLSLEPLDKKWESFGWNVIECKNKISDIINTIRLAKKSTKPSVIIVNTSSDLNLPKLHKNNKPKDKTSPLYHLGLGLQKIAEKRDDVIVLTADLKYSTCLEKFAEKYRSKFVECGIAEANMLGTSYGLAASGKCVFAVTHAIWLTGRTWETMRTICADGLDVKFIGTHAGLSNGQDGFSHHSTEDLASLRAFHGLKIISPSTCKMTYESIIASSEIKGPVYIRIPRISFENILEDSKILNKKFKLGKCLKHFDGKAISIFVSGVLTPFAIQAWMKLHSLGIECDLIEVPTIKPLDEKTILSSCKKTKRALVIEDHSKYSGLGSAISELCAEKFPIHIHTIGIVQPSESAPAYELYEKYGLESNGIVQVVRNLLCKK